MWETVILHDFIQEEKKQQFNNQIKGKNGNKMITIKQRELTATSKQATDPELGDKVIKW